MRGFRTKNAKRLALVGGMAATVLPWALPDAARAQSAPPGPGQQQVQSMEEVVVTARRREERLVDVPVSLSVVGGDKISEEGINDVRTLYGEVPGLYFTQVATAPTQDFTYLSLRGVGATTLLEPAVGVFVDGIYQTALGFNLDFLDLERVEVLRGPQGALFGRNTEGGALNIVTRKPGPVPRVRADVTWDSFNTRGASASVSGPLADNIFAGAALSYRDTDGFIDNVTLGRPQDDRRTISGRVAARFLTGSGTEINLAADFFDLDGHQVTRGVPAGCGCYDVYDNTLFPFEQRIVGGKIEISHELPWAQLKSLTGARFTRSYSGFDSDSTALDLGYIFNTTKQSSVSQEFRITSNTPDSPFRWTGGVYFFHEHEKIDRSGDFIQALPDLHAWFADVTVVLPAGRVFISPYGTTTLTSDLAVKSDPTAVQYTRLGGAVFAEAGYKWGRFDFAAAARYSSEHVDYDAFTAYLIDNLAPNVAFYDSFNVSAGKTFSGFSPQGSVTYRINDDINAYVSVARGFKSGSFQKTPTSLISGMHAVENETSTNYEVGLKGQLFDRKLTFSAAAYHIELENMQVEMIIKFNNLFHPAIDNAAEAKSDGFEVEFNARPVPWLSIDGNVARVETRFKRYVDANGLDRTGEPFPYVPEQTASLGVETRWPVGSDSRMKLGARYTYVGGYRIGDGSAFSPTFHIAPHNLVDAKLSLETGRWTAIAFVDNIFDDYSNTRTILDTLFFVSYDKPNPPRRIGVRLSYAY